MLQEISNKRDLYPCLLKRSEASQAEIKAANYIQDIKVCIQAQTPFSATVIQASKNSISIRMTSESDSDTFVVTFNETGVAASSDRRLIKENSYVTFTESYSDSIPAVTYNIPLLPQCILYIPKGLQISCYYGTPTQTAESVPYNEQPIGNRYKFTQKIDFLSGYNFQAYSINTGIALAAGIALGDGIIPTYVISDTVGSQYISGRVLQIKGIRAINGQTKNLQIATQGSIGMTQSLINQQTLQIILFKLQQEGE